MFKKTFAKTLGVDTVTRNEILHFAELLKENSKNKYKSDSNASPAVSVVDSNAAAKMCTK